MSLHQEKVYLVRRESALPPTTTVMGKVEKDPPWRQLTPHYLPWHGHVTALTIAPQYRRLGLAQSLTKALERGCEEENAWFVDLFVREGNKTAVGLYEGLGYVHLGSQPTVYTKSLMVVSFNADIVSLDE